ncbi:MAG: ROK family protein [Bacteroidota bacterium]
MMTLGVDIGGSHLSCALVDNQTNELIAKSIARKHYDHTLETNALLSIWATAIEAALAHLPNDATLSGIGFAMPGPFDYTNGISKMEHKLVSLYEKHLPTALNECLKSAKSIDMRFNNDASSFAIGEAFKGLGHTKKRMVVITLGTGFGAAFLEDKLPIVDRSDVPPEGCLWHLPFAEGIADDYFSTRWFVKEYESLTKEKIAGVKNLLEKDAAVVQAIFARFTDNLSNFLAPHLENFKAEILVIGGNISKALDHFKTPLLANLQQQNINIEIAPSTLLEDAAIIGSAQLFNPQYWSRISKVLPKLL